MEVSSLQPPRGRSNGPPPSRSPDGRERAGLAVLSGGRQRIPDGEPDERAEKSLAQIAGGTQRGGLEQRIAR